MHEDHSVPLVSVRALGKGGLLAETEADNGVTHLLAELLTTGTSRYTAEQIAERIDATAGGLPGLSCKNSVGLRGDFLKQFWTEASTSSPPACSSRASIRASWSGGPVMLLWFSTLAVLGLYNVVDHPSILAALNPLYGLEFLFENKAMALVAMGNVVLAVTGAEALYADMGHFGRKPIQRAWFAFVLPALVLNYFGQGALILAEPASAQNPFFLSAPEWALYPLVALSALATVIASQAVISGAFSVTRQAMQLGFMPRMEVQHTSEKEQGQIYLPAVNWGLMAAVMILVLGFRSSNNLAAAFGIGVTGDMVIPWVRASVVVARVWGGGWGRAAALFFVSSRSNWYSSRPIS